MRVISGAGRLGGTVALLFATSVHAEAATEPWARTVALSTACYSSQDEFTAQNQTALESVAADAGKQTEINDGIARQLSSALAVDPMAAAARMQENLMKDPQSAMKLLQSTGATDPEAVQADLRKALDEEQQWQAEEKKIGSLYATAMETALVPARAKFAALRKKLGITEGWGVGESGTPDWAFAQYDAIKREADRAYEAACPRWWGPSGAMHGFMKLYKDYLVRTRIPRDEKADAQKVAGLQMQNAPTKDYKSTAKLDAVKDYLQLAQRLFNGRASDPRCTPAQCRDIGGI